MGSRRRQLDADELEELQGEWDRILAAEGLSARIYKKQLRGTRKGARHDPLGMSRAESTLRETTAPAWVFDMQPTEAQRAPESASQALMEADRYADPIGDKEASEALRERVLDAMDVILGEHLADLYWRHHVSRISLQELADEEGIAKSTLQDRLSKAGDLLEAHLEQAVPEIATHLNKKAP